MGLYRRLEQAYDARQLDDPDWKWIEFARQWTQEADGLYDEMDKRMTSLYDRGYVMRPLGSLKSMFHAAAFRHESEYVQRKNSFEEAVNEFESFLAKRDAALGDKDG